MPQDMGALDRTPVLVELTPRAGAVQVALSPADVAQKSAEALENAMVSIRRLAERLVETIESVPQRPSEAEVEFGLKLDVEGNAFVTKASAEANLKVRLTWKA